MVGVDSLLLERFRLGERIAVGGMGTVFSGTDEKLDRAVAIKVLADNLAHDESFVERFRREARASAGLSHPNVASVYDYGEENGCHFIVMELVGGRDLAQVIRTEGPLSPERTVKIVAQVCAALAHAHAAGIIHRDVKPANVIVDDDDRVKVTDFGIARAAGDSKLTLTGSVLGTAQYISPEQANGAPLSPSSDLYSLGIVVYECLTGAVPFTGSSPMAVAMRHVNDEVPAPSELDRTIPGPLDQVVRRATEKDPAARFADATEMGAALSAATTTEGAAATAVLSGPATDVLAEPTTAAIATGAEQPGDHSVWPIPGDRWDPAALGRKVLVVFGALAVIALALLIWRVSSNGEPTRAERNQDAPAAAPEPTFEPDNFVVPESVIGMDAKDAEKLLEEEGLEVITESVGGDTLLAALAELELSEDLAEKDEVIATNPGIGESVEPGETITLFVSEGFDEEDSEEDKQHGPPDHADDKGKDKGEDD